MNARGFLFRVVGALLALVGILGISHAVGEPTGLSIFAFALMITLGAILILYGDGGKL